MDAAPRHPVYEFGDFRLDAMRRTLNTTDGSLVPLTPRVFDTLLCLVENAGKVVAKSALLQAVWPHVVVEEGSLQQAVHELRRALGERRHEHRYVVTVPGRGYQFVADVVVRDVDAGTGAGTQRAVHVSGHLDGDDRAGDARAVSRRWPRGAQDRMAVRALIAACVLAGTVALWPGSSERGLEAASAGSAAATAPDVAVNPSGGAPRPPRQGFAGEPAGVRAEVDARVRERMDLARFYFDRRQPGDLGRAERAYRQALDIDDAIAPAWAGLAGVYSLSLEPGNDLGLSRDAALERMRNAAERALAIDPELADAHIRRAEYLAETGDRRAPGLALQRATGLGQDSALVYGQRASAALGEGRLDDAVDALRRATWTDPLSLVARANLGAGLYFAGRYVEAAAELETALQLVGPRDEALRQVGHPGSPASSAAISLAKTLIMLRETGGALGLVRAWPDGPYRDHCLAIALRESGEHGEADAALHRLVRSDPDEPHWVAEVYAHRGDLDEAFLWIARATERSRASGDTAQLWRRDLRYSPFARALRADPRWAAFVAGPPRLAER